MSNDPTADLISRIGRILWLLSYPEDIDEEIRDIDDELEMLLDPWTDYSPELSREARHAIKNVASLYWDIQEAQEQIQALPPHPLLGDLRAALILADEALGGEPWHVEIDLRAGDEEQAIAICREDVEQANRMAGDLLKLTYAKLRAHLDEIAPLSDRSFTPRKLAAELDCDTDTINKYAKLARVETPSRGKRNHRYSAAEAIKIAKCIISGRASSNLKKNATEFLEVLR